MHTIFTDAVIAATREHRNSSIHVAGRYCNDEMLRIIGRTIEHVIGRSSRELEGIETEANVAVNPEEEKGAKEDDQNVYMLDIIDASGFLHKGSAISSKFRVDASALASRFTEVSRATVSSADISATVLKLEQECMRCGITFTWFGFGARRHHCRSCWRAFCADHCSKKVMVCNRETSYLFR